MANPALNLALNNRPGRILWIDYLRSFITILVIAHHSSLAYTTFAQSSDQAYMLSSAPIVDKNRWIGLDIFENFNDVFFMALMFFIGGIFIVAGLEKKGSGPFIRDRFYRLFVPFLITVSTAMLLAYYPAFHSMRPEAGIYAFLKDFFITERWPPGPPWFIWVLFLFNLLIALSGKTAILFIKKGGVFIQTLRDRPFKLVIIFIVITWLLYVPASWIFGAYTWTGFGPLVFQKSRLLLYFSFFILGSMTGSQDAETGLFSKDGKFVKRWPVWLAGCIFFYALLTGIHFIFPHGTGPKGLGEWGDKITHSTIYILSTCFSSLAFLTLFRKWITRSGKIWNSLCDNAYCMYLIHYIFVIWCQYILMEMDFPAIIKFGITFIFSAGASWMFSIQLRKIPIIKVYI